MDKIRKNLYYELTSDNHCFYDSKDKQGIMVCFNRNTYSKYLAADMAEVKINELRNGQR